MEYTDAIKKLISLYGEDILKDHFLSFSILSDYLGSSIYSNKLLLIFDEANKRLDLYTLFKEHNLEESKDILSNDFKDYSYNCDFNEFENAIDPIAELLNPLEFKQYKSKMVTKNESVKEVEVVKAKKEESKNNSNGLSSNKKLLENISISVNNCLHFYICYGKNSDNKYYLHKASLPKVSCFSTISTDELDKNLDLSIDGSPIDIYYLYLPKNKYKSINVNVQNGALEIYGSNRYTKFLCEDIKINIENGLFFLNTLSTSCMIKGCKGDVYLMGTYGFLRIDKLYSNIEGRLTFKSKMKDYSFYCTVYRGDIDVQIHGLHKSDGIWKHGLHKSDNLWNRLFKRKFIFDTPIIDNKDNKRIGLILSTNHGKIIINK